MESRKRAVTGLAITSIAIAIIVSVTYAFSPTSLMPPSKPSAIPVHGVIEFKSTDPSGSYPDYVAFEPIRPPFFTYTANLVWNGSIWNYNVILANEMSYNMSAAYRYGSGGGGSGTCTSGILNLDEPTDAPVTYNIQC